MNIKPIILIIALVLGQSAGALAQDRHFEIIPFVGFRAGGSFLDDFQDETLVVDESSVYGLTVDMDYDATGQVQLIWSHQSSEFKPSPDMTGPFELDIDYFHFGGMYCWARDDKFKPYVGVSIGATHFKPLDSMYDDEWRFSMGMGLGLKYFVTPWLGLVLEGRAYGTFMGGSGAIFCGEDGCQIAIQQDLFGQFEGRTGIVVRF